MATDKKVSTPVEDARRLLEAASILAKAKSQSEHQSEQKKDDSQVISPNPKMPANDSSTG